MNHSVSIKDVFKIELTNDLTDILHSIIYAETAPSDSQNITVDEEVDIANTIMELMYDYTVINPTMIQDPYFHEDMIESIVDLIDTCFPSSSSISSLDPTDEDMENLIDIAEELFYSQVMPKRSSGETYLTTQSLTPAQTTKIRKHLTCLKNMPQPEQRTNAWYEYRHNLITASNAFKIFESDKEQNSLIYEKCKPLVLAREKSDSDSECSTEKGGDGVPPPSSFEFILTDSDLMQVIQNYEKSPMRWGQKYEEVSKMYYEELYSTTVEEYGCLMHPTYTFLGASPDGINVDPKSALYGRMLEIKNIVNREITGIPKKEYWVQMQLQMETCSLDECDFLETRFKEYESRDHFYEDVDKDDGAEESFYKTATGKYKGIILCFVHEQNASVKYDYKPITMTENEFETAWMPERICEWKESGFKLAKIAYWWLEEVSCVLVFRNQHWFTLNVPRMQEFWEIILRERVDGYEHRAPTRRTKVQRHVRKGSGVDRDALPLNQCMITNTGSLIRPREVVKSVEEEPIVENNILHIRTESFDEVIDND